MGERLANTVFYDCTGNLDETVYVDANGNDVDTYYVVNENILTQVVNFDLPNIAEDYVHRIGRTGRAGFKGQAVSLVSADEFAQLSEIEYLIKQLIEREYIKGFEPVNDVPASRLDRRPKRPKKPKQPKVYTQNGQVDEGEKKERKVQDAGRRSRYRGRK